MTSGYYYSGSNSKRSQEKTFHRIDQIRKGKRLLKKLLIVVAVILALAVALSYVFITKESGPDNLKVPDKGTHSIF